MKTYILKVFSLTAIITFLSASFINAQNQTGLRDIQADTSGEAKINKVLEDSGNAFKEGLLNLQDNRRSQAREKFDKSVEVFLMSNFNVRTTPKLGECYDKLVETIYRMEFPADRQPPQIQDLALTCNWDIKSELANNITRITKTIQNNTNTASNSS